MRTILSTAAFVAVLSTSAFHPEAKPLHAGLNYRRYLEERNQTLERFERWRESAAGKQAFDLKLIPVMESRSADAVEDQLQRFAMTEQSIEKLRALNPEANFSTDSPFTIMTDEEFKDYVAEGWATSEAPMVEHKFEADRDGETVVDWSQTGCVGRVKGQGKCGSCWAFGTIAAVEAGYCLRNNRQLVHFADQQVTSCTENGCKGGFPQNSLSYIMRNGLCTEDVYPYRQCRRTNLNIRQVVRVPQSEQALENAVRGRPVAVGLAAGNSAWKQYQSGVLSTCTSTQLDHVVLVYG
ncbi:TPA: hypothetical protein N0F65_012511, partial [Lagenidium giganteum]